MIYKVIGLMSGSSLDGLDIAYVHLQERVSGTAQAPRGWDFQFIHTDCYAYSPEWRARLAGATGLSAREYLLLHAEYGRYVGELVGSFIAGKGLEFQVQLIASHGHTVFHDPARRMTAQLGDGSAIAAVTGINVVSDLRSMDVALGGQGAPIVPIGEELLLAGYELLLNLGGIANVSRRGGSAGGAVAGAGGGSSAGAGSRGDGAGAVGTGAGAAVVGGGVVAFDVVPANRVLNELAGDAGMAYDKDGMMAAAGRVDAGLLGRLNALEYYGLGYPKSLANEFGLEVVLPIVRAAGLKTEDALRTYVEHIAKQIYLAVKDLGARGELQGVGGTQGAEVTLATGGKMLVTGGGAHNGFLVGRLRERLTELGVEVVVPEAALVDYKEALVMALIGVLRWREERTVLASVTGAKRDSIGGAVWIGQEA
jgi:anhydro-N-acetylmuramic acid kinase